MKTSINHNQALARLLQNKSVERLTPEGITEVWAKISDKNFVIYTWEPKPGHERIPYSEGYTEIPVDYGTWQYVFKPITAELVEQMGDYDWYDPDFKPEPKL